MHWEFYEELFSYAVFALRVFGGKVEAKAVKGGCMHLPSTRGGKSVPRALQRIDGMHHSQERRLRLCCSLTETDFFSLKMPSFLLPGFLTPPKIFLYYIEVSVKSLDSAAVT